MDIKLDKSKDNAVSRTASTKINASTNQIFKTSFKTTLVQKLLARLGGGRLVGGRCVLDDCDNLFTTTKNYRQADYSNTIDHYCDHCNQIHL